MGLNSLIKGASNTAATVPAPPPAAPQEQVIQAKPKRMQIQDETTPAAPAVLTAKDAKQGTIYKVNGTAGVFLCSTDIGGTSFYSFKGEQPTPMLVSADSVIEPIQIQEAPKVVEAPAPAPAVEPAAVAAPAPTPEVSEEPAKRKRRTKVEMEAAKASESPAPVPEAPKEAAAAVSASEPFAGVYIYFGCSPLGVAATTLNAYTESLDSQLRELAKIHKDECEDIRVVDGRKYPDLGFMKWKAFLAGLVKEIPPPPGHYIVTYGDERVETVAEAIAGALASKAARVVRGGGR